MKIESNNFSVAIKNEQIKNHEVFQSTMNLAICLTFVHENGHTKYLTPVL